VNLFLHAEATRPFIGAGLVGRWWSFSINLRPLPAEGAVQLASFRPITPSEVYGHVKERLQEQHRAETGLNYSLPGLDISDRVSGPGWLRVAGDGRERYEPTDLPPHIHHTDGRMSPSHLERLMNAPAQTLRYFQCVQARWHGGEMVASAFLHVAVEGRSMYVEVTPTLTSPIQGRYKNVDVFMLPRLEDMAEYAARTIREVVPYMFAAPDRLVRAYGRPYLERVNFARLERRAKSRKYLLDYGARHSIRDLASLDEVKNYLQLFDPEKYALNPRRHQQLLDAEAYTKTLETQVLDALMHFLEERHLDTAEFRARRDDVLRYRTFAAALQGDTTAWGQREPRPVDSPYAPEELL
jgi:hypothetical protein